MGAVFGGDDGGGASCVLWGGGGPWGAVEGMVGWVGKGGTFGDVVERMGRAESM